MKTSQQRLAEVDVRFRARAKAARRRIHLRARAKALSLIDRAAELTGTNRSRFMMASALEEAKNVLLEQTMLVLDGRSFAKMLDWMDAPATAAEAAGMKRLGATEPPWLRG